ncbi:hypothetical protein Cadr_000008516 [Camelus dromedarius]|uniref:Uncharacterized protein n=1 Tax=Camelus dromedarius TaxID=9838 RepID=A0A5N4DYP8_CAMDR|nr:hypothetical protein Cadr_000008516 [Camelus dromedarius]
MGVNDKPGRINSGGGKPFNLTPSPDPVSKHEDLHLSCLPGSRCNPLRSSLWPPTASTPDLLQCLNAPILSNSAAQRLPSPYHQQHDLRGLPGGWEGLPARFVPLHAFSFQLSLTGSNWLFPFLGALAALWSAMESSRYCVLGLRLRCERQAWLSTPSLQLRELEFGDHLSS